jgi:hypothetical protein
MPRFYRNSRQLLRIFLAAVLGMGLLGWNYAVNNWQITPDMFQIETFTENVDWLDLVAGLVESAIEIFQSATGR